MDQFIVSTVDRTILVPKTKRSFSNTKNWKFVLKAGKPVLIGDNIDDGEMPMEVAKTYSGSYPHVMSIVDGGKKVIPKATIQEVPADTGIEFDAVEFLAQDPEPREEALTDLKTKQLLDVCAVLDLSGSPKDTKKVLANKIIQEINVRSGRAEKEE